MFPRLHPLQYLLLSVGRQSIEVLQPLLKLLLPLRGQTPKRRIALKRSSLLIERLLAIAIKPLAGMMALRRRLIWPGHIISSRLLWLRLKIPLWRGLVIP
ncbi:MAG: hypothetical protein AUG89_10355 [Acidobacteria bacterium 13_1_20CM_4_56_7]|jgi:hypothetical protein|nr:MAG: hypothetical protein AUG89_10355 [Acidobacteria bacterium 13_1_20CM_4_56_7]